MSNATSSRRGFLRSSLGAAVIAVTAPFVAFGRIMSDPLGGPTNSTGEPGDIPQQLFLSQNYPNPFNALTNIKYGLPSDTHVRLTLHTLLGAEIQVAVDRVQEAGTYVFELSAPSLPSGVYFYRLQTDLGTLTRRMTVSR
jgi:hypothetical protein